MKEIGTVTALKGSNAEVTILRHEACGDCHACRVGKGKMTMQTLAKNMAGAGVGDEVVVEMRTVNVIQATGIMYGIPLLGFLIGCALGYVAALNFGLDAVLVPFFSGIALTAVVYLVIRLLDKSGRFHGKYQPVITECVKQA